MSNSTRASGLGLDHLDVDEIAALARYDVDQGRLEQGMTKIKALLNMDSIPVDAIRTGARLYAKLGMFERARPLFEKFLTLHPDALEERFEFGLVSQEQGDTETAMQTWNAVLASAPRFAPALLYSALLLAQQGDLVEARLRATALLESVPQDHVYFIRGKDLLQSIDSQANIQSQGATLRRV